MGELGSLLYSLMQDKNISYGELSKLTGISKATLQRYVSGNTEKIPTSRLESIANALGVSVGYLHAKSAILEAKNRGEYTSDIIELVLDDNKNYETRKVSDDDIKFALFGGDGEITDAMYDEVKRFAHMVKLREEAEKKKE